MNRLYKWLASKYHNSFKLIHWPYGGIKKGVSPGLVLADLDGSCTRTTSTGHSTTPATGGLREPGAAAGPLLAGLEG